MVDMQLLNDAVATLAIACGIAIFLAISVVAVAAVRQRRATTRKIHAAVERLVTHTGSVQHEPAFRGPAPL